MKIWNSIRIFFTVKWESLKSVWAYLPVVWNDRNWDYSSFLDLMEFKLERMAEYHLRYGHHVGNEDDARDLRVAAQLCARIRDDDYSKIPLEAHDKKWGENQNVFIPTNHNITEWRMVRLNVRNDKDREQEREEFLVISKHADIQRQNDLDYLGKMLSEKLLGWWD